MASPTLEFWRYVDRSIDDYDNGRGEYLKAEVTSDGTTWVQLDLWTEEEGDDDDTWHKEAYDLLPYSGTAFQVRFVASMSSPGEEVGIDDVRVLAEPSAVSPPAQPPEEEDTTPPTITVPGDITREQRHATLGSFVEFTVTATDETDGVVDVTCDRDAGWYTVGVYTVTCTATDAADNTATTSFTITITRDAPISNPPTCTTTDSLRETDDACTINDMPATQILGGSEISLRYQVNNSNPLIYNHLASTLTIGAVNANGDKGIVVSGHAMNTHQSPNVVASTKVVVANLNNTLIQLTEFGVPSFNIGPYVIQNADAMFLPLYGNVTVPTNQVVKQNGTIVDISGKGGLHESESYPNVELLGHVINSNGTVSYTDVTVRDPEGILTHQALATYSSSLGDSGGPVVHYEQDGTAKLFGIHVGRICSTNFNQSTPPATTNDIDCDYLDWPLKVFTPWENVRTALDLR